MYVVKIIKKHKKIKMTNTNYNQKMSQKDPVIMVLMVQGGSKCSLNNL